jgi:hypothetical protein
MVQKTLTGWKRAALNVFIAFHVLGLAIWALPDSPLRKKLARPFEKYVVYLGLWHSWGMFAPKPLDINFDVQATLKYRDGSTAVWIAPRVEQLSMWERVPKERYRKWRERIRSDDYSMIWDDTSRWIARQMNKNPQNPPVEVRLTRYWAPIPKVNLNQDHQPLERTIAYTNSFTYAVTPIKPKDL